MTSNARPRSAHPRRTPAPHPASPGPPEAQPSLPAAGLTPGQVHGIARALADSRRFGIFQQIAQQHSLTCSCLDVKEELSPATISHHLRELTKAGLIDTEREGRHLRLTARRDIWNAYLQHLASL